MLISSVMLTEQKQAEVNFKGSAASTQFKAPMLVILKLVFKASSGSKRVLLFNDWIITFTRRTPSRRDVTSTQRSAVTNEQPTAANKRTAAHLSIQHLPVKVTLLKATELTEQHRGTD